MKHDAGRGKIEDGEACSPQVSEESLNDHERIRLVMLAAAVTFEIPAAGSDFTGRDSPRGVTFLQKPRPGAAGAAKSLDEA